MEELRKLHKKKMKEYVERVKESSSWKNILKTFNLSNMEWEILSKRHYPEALTLLCYQFSMYGGTINHLSFHISVEENLQRFKKLLLFAIEMGTSLVTVNKETNRLVAVGVTWDILDESYIDNFNITTNDNNSNTNCNCNCCDHDKKKNNNNNNSNYKKKQNIFQLLRKQINQKATLSHPKLGKDIFDSNMKPLKHIKYGEVRYTDTYCVDPMTTNQGLGMINTILGSIAMMNLGYSMVYGLGTHPASAHLVSKTIKKSQSNGIWFIYDYSDFEFDHNNDNDNDNDGDKDNHDPNIQKQLRQFRNMGDIFMRLKNEFNFTDKYIDYLKQNAKILVYTQELQNMRFWNGVVEKNYFNCKDLVLEFVLNGQKNDSASKL